jgi:hypothetical protein
MPFFEQLTLPPRSLEGGACVQPGAGFQGRLTGLGLFDRGSLHPRNEGSKDPMSNKPEPVNLPRHPAPGWTQAPTRQATWWSRELIKERHVRSFTFEHSFCYLCQERVKSKPVNPMLQSIIVSMTNRDHSFFQQMAEVRKPLFKVKKP